MSSGIQSSAMPWRSVAVRMRACSPLMPPLLGAELDSRYSQPIEGCCCALLGRHAGIARRLDEIRRSGGRTRCCRSGSSSAACRRPRPPAGRDWRRHIGPRRNRTRRASRRRCARRASRAPRRHRAPIAGRTLRAGCTCSRDIWDRDPGRRTARGWRTRNPTYRRCGNRP